MNIFEGYLTERQISEIAQKAYNVIRQNERKREFLYNQSRRLNTAFSVLEELNIRLPGDARGVIENVRMENLERRLEINAENRPIYGFLTSIRGAR